MKRRREERGSAMLITMIVISALMGGAAVLVQLNLSSSHGTELAKHGLTALYCAEAGLTAARATVAASYPQWAGSLCTTTPSTSCTQPAWLASTAFSHDLDGDGVDDFVIYIKDNDDDGTAANNKAVDNDLQIFVVSRCIKYPESPKEVEELIQYSGGGTCYDAQQGGCGANGNSAR